MHSRAPTQVRGDVELYDVTSKLEESLHVAMLVQDVQCTAPFGSSRYMFDFHTRMRKVAAEFRAELVWKNARTPTFIVQSPGRIHSALVNMKLRFEE